MKKKNKSLAVIDIGSSSIRLVIFEKISYSAQIIFNEKNTLNLGSMINSGEFIEERKAFLSSINSPELIIEPKFNVFFSLKIICAEYEIFSKITNLIEEEPISITANDLFFFFIFLKYLIILKNYLNKKFVRLFDLFLKQMFF